jgi:YfiH family protein
LDSFCDLMMTFDASFGPTPSVGFRWVHGPAGPQLVAEQLGPFTHGWTTRQLELRGTAEVERAGWDRVAEAAGVDPGAIARVRQVHGTSVYDASAPEVFAASKRDADIIVSGDERIAVAVQVADCVPLLIADTETGRVVAAHAGWRGTAADAAGVAVAALAPNRSLTSVIAALGPSIGPCCYRVGDELHTAFGNAGWSPPELDRWFVKRNGDLYLDLWQANLDQLARAGVSDSNVTASRLCTSCHPNWFHSYRREGAGAGRLVGFIRSA